MKTAASSLPPSQRTGVLEAQLHGWPPEVVDLALRLYRETPLTLDACRRRAVRVYETAKRPA